MFHTYITLKLSDTLTLGSREKLISVQVDSHVRPSSPVDQTGVPLTVASLDGGRLVVTRRLAVDRVDGGLGPQGAGRGRGPQGPAVALVRRGGEVLVLEVQHGQAHVEVLALGRDVVRAPVDASRSLVDEEVVDAAGAREATEEETDEAGEEERAGTGSSGHNLRSTKNLVAATDPGLPVDTWTLVNEARPDPGLVAIIVADTPVSPSSPAVASHFLIAASSLTTHARGARQERGALTLSGSLPLAAVITG